MILAQTLDRLATALDSGGVVWGLAGGFAFSIYCQPRATVDIDIAVVGSVDTVAEICRTAFPSVYRKLTEMDYPLVTVARLLLSEADDETVLDVLKPRAPDFAAYVAATIRHIEIDTLRVPVIAPEVLWALKATSARDRDRADRQEIERALGDSLDRGSVARWTSGNGPA